MAADRGRRPGRPADGPADDTARSGASLLRSVRLLRIGGALVGMAVCVLDRDAGATALLADHHLVLRALVRAPDGAR
ncbi:hypothetical protein [Streptomyces sp. NPDC003247]|uniref:hypothetical protein n=1 Tax=Streptomyces sp. NPDC003247 TaxID=3364677 RepID=UPI0036A4D7C7